jgi:hypothetical protein
VTTGIQNLPDPLARAEAAYRDPAAQLAPVSRNRLARAMVSALLDPARVREANVSVPFELWVMGRMTASFARQAGRRGPGRNGPRAEPI